MSRARANNLQTSLRPQLSNGLQHQSDPRLDEIAQLLAAGAQKAATPGELRIDHRDPVDRFAAMATGYSRVPKTIESSSMMDDQLKEIANLLAVAVHSVRARMADARWVEISAGLGPRRERVFGPEGGR
jgi:hypothetical protein